MNHKISFKSTFNGAISHEIKRNYRRLGIDYISHASNYFLHRRGTRDFSL